MIWPRRREGKKKRKSKDQKMRREGVEPPPTGWKPVILPLNYRREIAIATKPILCTYPPLGPIDPWSDRRASQNFVLRLIRQHSMNVR